MFGVTTGLGGWAYLLMLTLHVVCVIVGFGGVVLNGIWGSTLAKMTGDGAGVMAQTLTKVSNVAEGFIFAVPVFGIMAIWLSGDAHSFASPWVSVSIVLYLLGLGLSLGVIMPTNKQLVAFAVAGNAPSAQRTTLEKKMAVVSGVLHLILITVILLMVFGPVTPWLVAD